MDLLPLNSQFGNRLGNTSPAKIYKSEEGVLQIRSGDRIIAVVNGNLRCGVLQPRNHAIENSRELKMNVLWDGHSVTEVVTLTPSNFMIVDRVFGVGQRVVIGPGPLAGTIIGRKPSFSLQIHNSNHLIFSDSPLKSLQPLTKLFHGVFIEYMGWFGEIAEVVRRIKVEFEPNVTCKILRREPVEMRSLTHVKLKKKRRDLKRKRLLNRNYPYIVNRSFPTSDVNLPGSPIKFSGRDLNKIASRLRGYSIRGTEIIGKVIATDVEDIAVDWFTRIPGLPKEPKPEMCVPESELSKIRYFYIHPCRYFFKGGLCEYDLQHTDDLIHIGEFEQHLSSTFESKKTHCTPDESPEKRLRFETIDLQVPTKLIVHKHIVRHQFEVLVDGTDEIKMVYGSDLWPCPEDDHHPQKQCQPPFFVRMKSSPAYIDNKYGVVLRQHTVDAKVIVSVQWLRESDGRVDLLQVTKVDFLDIIGHKGYNELSVGTHVALTSGIPDLDKDGFQFGTILFIDRFRYGRIHVFCSVEMTEKRMWPFQLQRIKYEKPEPNMKRVERKFVYAKMPRILRGTGLQGILVNPYQEDQKFISKSLRLGTGDFSDSESGSDSDESDEEVECEKDTPFTNLSPEHPTTDTNVNVHIAHLESINCN